MKDVGIGRMVHYVLPLPEQVVGGATVRAAMIVNLTEDGGGKDGVVELRVFAAGRDRTTTVGVLEEMVHYNVSGLPGTWHWHADVPFELVEPVEPLSAAAEGETETPAEDTLEPSEPVEEGTADPP